MEKILFSIKYGGVVVDINTIPEENVLGVIYPITFHDDYAFTICMDEEEEWSIMREQDGNVPVVEEDLLNAIVKKLRRIWYQAA